MGISLCLFVRIFRIHLLFTSVIFLRCLQQILAGCSVCVINKTAVKILTVGPNCQPCCRARFLPGRMLRLGAWLRSSPTAELNSDPGPRPCLPICFCARNHQRSFDSFHSPFTWRPKFKSLLKGLSFSAGKTGRCCTISLLFLGSFPQGSSLSALGPSGATPRTCNFWAVLLKQEHYF